jgi:hypothetical protein
MEGAPGVLPSLLDLLGLEHVETDWRLLRVDGVGAIELLDALREDVEQEHKLRFSSDHDVAPDRCS